jgi:polar amino acid transport system ATP-binding protein
MLNVENLCCKFGDSEVLSGVSLAIANGEIVTVIGGSGAGKTTIVRALCGLEKYDGEVSVDGRAPEHGDYGLVQQGCSLFEHMDVLKNVSYALRAVKNFSREKARDIAAAALVKFGLGDKLAVSPSKLSGGQRQRVAIARALVLNPKVMLFDEPTSALDPEMTSDVIAMIRTIAADGMTILMVTHDLQMARRASDRMLLLEHGRIVEDSPTEEFFSNPRSERARSFLRNAAWECPPAR